MCLLDQFYVFKHQIFICIILFFWSEKDRKEVQFHKLSKSRKE